MIQPYTVLPPPSLPSTNSEVKPKLEILPGLIVEPRFINGNWHLVPADADKQLPDVESMVIEELATEITLGELTPVDKCCIIEALAKRRRANIETLRNIMGLFGTDKPLPLTEIPPLALPEGEDLLLNDMPTADSSGNELFDFIEYSWSPYQKNAWDLQPSFGEVLLGLDWQTFKFHDKIRVWIEEIATGKRVSPTYDLELRHTEYYQIFWEDPRNPQYEWRCSPLDSYCFVTPYGSDTFDLVFDSGPFGCGKPNQRSAESPCGFRNCYPWDDPMHLPPNQPVWPKDDSLGIKLSAFHIGRVGGQERWRSVPNGKYYIHVEKLGEVEYGVDLAVNYYNHTSGKVTTETRQYYRPYIDKSILKMVASKELILLDDMRVNMLINSPQWTLGKSLLAKISQTEVAWARPPAIIPPSLPSPPEIEIEIPGALEIPPSPEPPEIELPPIEPLPFSINDLVSIASTLFSKQMCSYDAFLDSLFGGSA